MRTNPSNEQIQAAYEAARQRCAKPEALPPWELLSPETRELAIRLYFAGIAWGTR